MMACARFTVSGRVQGVFFRASARDEALRLGLAGHARNLSDGRVEVIACGDAAALAALERWLRRGPALARVTAVNREKAANEPVPAGFRVG
jgi:acylphosphatase